ncbi:cytochrome c oxidase subunit II [Alkalilacustris brevis]|uniref:cytochrome c oxidase subunit II n=1 Tax=Alkalilacustris brevis TaxID=2026338 RepID=UPI000E0CD2B8|nr:cytochrome c oxidase subunit II [Alkalilacustris brevis]
MKRFAPVPVPILLAGCDGPLSTLSPAGPVATEVAWLWWAMLAGAAAIAVLVGVLIAMGFGLPRETPARRWTHGWGLGFSLAVLSTLLTAGLWVGERILPRDDGAVEVRAHAFMWGWSFTQPGEGGAMVETAGTLYIPTGQPVDVIVTSEDVIHSFWVPQLAGKIDAIPGRENVMRLQADSPGTYGGLCAEFCGVGHAGMRFELVAYAAGELPEALQPNDLAVDHADDHAEEATDD